MKILSIKLKKINLKIHLQSKKTFPNLFVYLSGKHTFISINNVYYFTTTSDLIRICVLSFTLKVYFKFFDTYVEANIKTFC